MMKWNQPRCSLTEHITIDEGASILTIQRPAAQHNITQTHTHKQATTRSDNEMWKQLEKSVISWTVSNSPRCVCPVVVLTFLLPCWRWRHEHLCPVYTSKVVEEHPATWSSTMIWTTVVTAPFKPNGGFGTSPEADYIKHTEKWKSRTQHAATTQEGRNRYRY